MNTLESNTSIEQLERCAKAERLLEVGGSTPDANPWDGSRKRLERALEAEREKQERAEAVNFCAAVERYRGLLKQLPAVQEAFSRTHAKVNETQDGRALRERLNGWLAAHADWQLARREGLTSALPPGFSQQDIDRIKAFEAAVNEHQKNVNALEQVTQPLSSLEEQYPVLKDMRSN